jgi:Tfp pilus assembly protein PilN
VRAVNLIPGDARRGGRSAGSRPRGGPAILVVVGLAVAVLLMTVYVLTNNTISDRKAKIASLQAQAAQEQALATRFVNYTSFASLARARAQTVMTIATARFDWHAALSDLSKVVPADTSLQSLFGSVAPGASVSGSGSGGGGSSSLRSDIANPAFELTGCTKTQDDVARLMSRLRLINGVIRVTLGDSVKNGTAQSGTSVSSSSGAGAEGCGPNTPTFDIVVFFSPLPGAGATGVTAAATSGASPATPGTAAHSVTTSTAGAGK